MKFQIKSFIRELSSGSNTLQYELTNVYDLHLLEEGPSTNVFCTRDEGLDFYKKMYLIRRMENTIDNMYNSRSIRGFCHLCIGQVCC